MARPTPQGGARDLVGLGASTGIAVALLALALGDETLTRAVAGAGLSAGCATHLWATGRWRGRGEIARLDVLGVGLGLALVVLPAQTYRTVTVLAGFGFVILGVVGTFRSTRAGGTWLRTVLRLAVLIPVAVALFLVAEVAVTVGLWLGAAAILADTAIRAGLLLGVTDLAHRGSEPLIQAWLGARGEQAEDRTRIADTVYFEGASAFSSWVRFGLMMIFASVISAMGVLGDSTAVVIGAMLIAPLINPMMGMGLALAMGWPKRLGQASLAVLGGIAIAIGAGWVLAAALRVGVDLESNSQVISRASPTLSDLVIAVAAGAAGAYVLSRTQVASSLPGVAIAIALVPPLSVVGVAAESGAWGQAGGTALLFLTNLVAILLVGGLVFVLTGVAPVARAYRGQRAVSLAVTGVLVTGLFVSAGLALNSATVAQQSVVEDQVRSSVDRWLGENDDFTVVSLDVTDAAVTVVLAGPGDPPDSTPLAQQVADDLGGEVRLDLQWIDRQQRVTSITSDS